MTTIRKVRQQGSARIVTLPSAMLTEIGADTGTALALHVSGGTIVATPVSEPKSLSRRRYTLGELLAGAERLPQLYADVAGALDGDPVGHEIG